MGLNVGTFPFGKPILSLVQKDQTPKRVFILGVYASAVHARWIGQDGRQKIGALAVASEPEIFWRGSTASAQEIISTIQLPLGAGRLLPASKHLNGPSGKALDDCFIAPLGMSRNDVWLCDLIPYSCMNENQEAALKREYDPLIDSLKLPEYTWSRLPDTLVSCGRRLEIEQELIRSNADIVITLGDQPLKWFTQHYGTASKLSAYGNTEKHYGCLHSFSVAGKQLQLLPLVHPRQAAKLGAHSTGWADLHAAWVKHCPVK